MPRFKMIRQEVRGNEKKGCIINGMIRQNWFQVAETQKECKKINGKFFGKTVKVKIPRYILKKYDGAFTSVSFECSDMAGAINEHISFKKNRHGVYTLWITWLSKKPDFGGEADFNIKVTVKGKAK